MLSKTCSKYKAEKPHEEYVKDKRNRDGLQSQCRECQREKHRRWHAANLEKGREYSRKWVAAHRERCRERSRKWVAANPEEARERSRRWRTVNPEKVLAHCATRRARKRSALDPNANLAAIAALHTEAKMAEDFTGQQFAVDHIVPLARGGKHHEDNLRSLPARLNSVKGAKLDSEVTDSDFKTWIHPAPTFDRVIPRGCLPCILRLRGARLTAPRVESFHLNK